MSAVAKRVLPALVACLALFLPAHAEEIAPDVLIQRITGELLAAIRQDKAIQAGNPRNIAQVVEARVLPHFEFIRMTRIAMGRNWRLASAEQQGRLTMEFRTLLLRTYSTALAGYRDHAITFRPLHMAPGAGEATVRSEVRQPGAQPLSVDYDMERTPNGWKIYDVTIGGVSLLTAYRDGFARELRSGGVDGLIQSLARKNHETDARFRAGGT